MCDTDCDARTDTGDDAMQESMGMDVNGLHSSCGAADLPARLAI